ncbi:response regulator [Rhodohalobacter sp.]|uniref:response regulator n=1 Tax=Rhodohalobacter sp. TaxID=1974210 RepID=UPI002ACD400A|nr:response regulator [Rhodohalobacter sp.]
MKKNMSKGSVIVVEDDMLLSLVESRIIEKLGYTVIGKAQSGKQAIDMARQLKPDVIVMDISLKGGMSGLDASEEIRRFSDIPIIFLSGSAESDLIKSAKKLGNADYLVKPIKADDMLNPLKKAVKKGGAKSAKVFSQAS